MFPIWPDLKESKSKLRVRGSEGARCPSPALCTPHLKAELLPGGKVPPTPYCLGLSEQAGGIQDPLGGCTPALEPAQHVFSPLKAELPVPRTPVGSGELGFPGWTVGL